MLSFFQNHQKFATLEKTRGTINHFFDIIGMKKLKSNTQLLPLPAAISFPLSLTVLDQPSVHGSVFGGHPGLQVVSVTTTAKLDGR